MDEYLVVQDTLGDGPDEYLVAMRSEDSGGQVFYLVVASAVSLTKAREIATALNGA
jgi:hypothetical protein